MVCEAYFNYANVIALAGTEEDSIASFYRLVPKQTTSDALKQSELDKIVFRCVCLCVQWFPHGIFHKKNFHII